MVVSLPEKDEKDEHIIYREYSGPPIYGSPHQRPPLLCDQKMNAQTFCSLYLPLTSGHLSNAASGHTFWVFAPIATPLTFKWTFWPLVVALMAPTLDIGIILLTKQSAPG